MRDVTAPRLQTVAPPGFCNRGEVRYGSIGGREYDVPPVPVVLSVYQRGSLLDGLAMYLSCDTKKFHDNESSHILLNFWTSTHRGKLHPPFPPGGAQATDKTALLTTESLSLRRASDAHTERMRLPNETRSSVTSSPLSLSLSLSHDDRLVLRSGGQRASAAISCQ